MNIFGFEVRRRARALLVVSGPLMEEEELTLAFGRVGQKHPLYSAILQLIDTAIANAYMQANVNIKDHAVLAGYVAAAEHLQMLRADMEGRRRAANEVGGRWPMPPLTPSISR